MMKNNSRLYVHLIMLFAMGNTPLVLADNNEDTQKDHAVMPAAPSGPYRSHIARDKERKVTAPSLAQRPPQQPMPAQNFNRNRLQPMPAPQWAQRPPQQPMPAQNFNRNRPQPMPAPQWVQPRVPEWVKNPPYGPKPPAWVTNPPKKPMYRYGNPNWNH